MKANVKYDMLEVLFFHAPRSDHAQTLASLQDAVEPRFEVEALELVSGSPLDMRKQTIRIASAMGELFESAAKIEQEVRELAGEGFAWTRVGAIRAGQTATVRG